MTADMDPDETKPCYLLELPFELRDEIWQYATLSGDCGSLLRTCHTTRAEVHRHCVEQAHRAKGLKGQFLQRLEIRVTPDVEPDGRGWLRFESYKGKGGVNAPKHIWSVADLDDSSLSNYHASPWLNGHIRKVHVTITGPPQLHSQTEYDAAFLILLAKTMDVVQLLSRLDFYELKIFIASSKRQRQRAPTLSWRVPHSALTPLQEPVPPPQQLVPELKTEEEISSWRMRLLRRRHRRTSSTAASSSATPIAVFPVAPTDVPTLQTPKLCGAGWPFWNRYFCAFKESGLRYDQYILGVLMRLRVGARSFESMGIHFCSDPIRTSVDVAVKADEGREEGQIMAGYNLASVAYRFIRQNAYFSDRNYDRGILSAAQNKLTLERLPEEVDRIVGCYDWLINNLGEELENRELLNGLREHQLRTRHSRSFNFFSERNARFKDIPGWPSTQSVWERPSPLIVGPWLGKRL